jgi:peptidoglycan-N-acetylglucosamine deacetylase
MTSNRTSNRPAASVSLDLDNVWSYMKTHGDEGWQDYPSYIEPLLAIVLDKMKRRGLRITVFIVGQDAALAKNAAALARISAEGHDIGNHSFSHEPWFHIYSPEKVEQEIRVAEDHIERVTGHRPKAYRGPGFSLTPETLRVLAGRGYVVDASTFPTFLGPLARAYYFFKSRNLSPSERKNRKVLFGKTREGFRPITPYLWRVPGQDSCVLEIPVTTMPLARVPIHMSYLLYLSMRSPTAALAYLRTAAALCKARGVQPSFLLHPLDFLGGDMEHRLAFFPAMALPTERKLAMLDRVLDELARHFDLVDIQTHAQRLLAAGGLRIQDAT